MDEQGIDLSEVPEISEEQMQHAVLRVGGKPVARRMDREAIRHLIAEEAAYWDTIDTGESIENETEWVTFEWTEREDRCCLPEVD